MMIAAAAINDGRFDSIFACKQGFADLWSVAVEIDELRPALDELIERSLMEKKGKAYELTAEAATNLSARRRSAPRSTRSSLRCQRGRRLIRTS